MAGSRPGALSAGCWATMIHFGHSGYVDSTKKILTAAQDIKNGYYLFCYCRRNSVIVLTRLKGYR